MKVKTWKAAHIKGIGDQHVNFEGYLPNTSVSVHLIIQIRGQFLFLQRNNYKKKKIRRSQMFLFPRISENVEKISATD